MQSPGSYSISDSKGVCQGTYKEGVLAAVLNLTYILVIVTLPGMKKSQHSNFMSFAHLLGVWD